MFDHVCREILAVNREEEDELLILLVRDPKAESSFVVEGVMSSRVIRNRLSQPERPQKVFNHVQVVSPKIC
jgi:hypothetical protein